MRCLVNERCGWTPGRRFATGGASAWYGRARARHRRRLATRTSALRISIHARPSNGEPPPLLSLEVVRASTRGQVPAHDGGVPRLSRRGRKHFRHSVNGACELSVCVRVDETDCHSMFLQRVRVLLVTFWLFCGKFASLIAARKRRIIVVREKRFGTNANFFSRMLKLFSALFKLFSFERRSSRTI